MFVVMSTLAELHKQFLIGQNLEKSPKQSQLSKKKCAAGHSKFVYQKINRLANQSPGNPIYTVKLV